MSRDLVAHVAGGLAASLIGDSMGCVTETLTLSEIAERYGRVTTLLAPTGTFADGRRAGELTDDGLLTLEVGRELVKGNGTTTAQAVADMLVRWAGDPELFARFAGPSSRKAIEMLRAGHTPEEAGAAAPLQNDLRTSNGAAMKVAPAGWVRPDDLPGAVELACLLSVPTHNSSISYAGASAVAAAVSSALTTTDPAQVMAAAIEGARLGAQLGVDRGVEVAGPSIEARLEVARDIATSDADVASRVRRLNEVFGCGLPITEAVPMALGLFLVHPHDPMELVIETVNLGGDTDTVAAIAGAIGGTLAGIDALDAAMVRQLEEINDIDIRAEAAAMVQITGQEGTS